MSSSPTGSDTRRRGAVPAGIAAGLGEREDGLVDLAKRPPAAPHPPPRLLGAYDPLLLGWASREGAGGPPKSLVARTGTLRPFALVAGRPVATWGYAGGEVTIEPLGKITRKATAALEA